MNIYKPIVISFTGMNNIPELEGHIKKYWSTYSQSIFVSENNDLYFLLEDALKAYNFIGDGRILAIFILKANCDIIKKLLVGEKIAPTSISFYQRIFNGFEFKKTINY